MQYEQIDASLRGSLRRHLTLALTISTVLICGAGGVAALAEISGAVVGSGKIIVQGRPKAVQHGDGGTVSEIHIQEGQTVTPGQLLFSLDPTLTDANLAIVSGQLATLEAQEARLMAEMAGADQIAFPAAIASNTDPRTLILMQGQVELMEARSDARLGRYNRLSSQIRQLEKRAIALEAQKDATADALALAEEEIDSKQMLSEKGLLSESELRSAKRISTQLVADVASMDAEILETQEEILARQLERAEIDEAFREQVLTDLDTVRAEIARLRQEEIAARDRRTRLSIRSPIGGTLHELTVHTHGQVLSPGETLVTIVPLSDRLIVETKLPPKDVDQVHPGQQARLRFTSLDQRTTPEVIANIIDVSPDASTDKSTGISYYSARLSIDPSATSQIGGDKLRPGMPVEVFIETRQRTILSYLIKPMMDQINHAMREE